MACVLCQEEFASFSMQKKKKLLFGDCCLTSREVIEELLELYFDEDVVAFSSPGDGHFLCCKCDKTLRDVSRLKSLQEKVQIIRSLVNVCYGIQVLHRF